MKVVTLTQIYADVMSVYGDNGNLLFAADYLRANGYEVATANHHFGERIPPADIYFFGGGQDGAQRLVSRDLAGENGKRLAGYLSKSYCLAVCGGYQLLGRYYLTNSGELIDGLGYLPVATYGSTERQVGLVQATCVASGRPIYGFENHAGKTYILDDSPALAAVSKRRGNNGRDGKEGIIFGRTIGTYLHGPILPKNPWLMRWWLGLGELNRISTIDSSVRALAYTN